MIHWISHTAAQTHSFTFSFLHLHLALAITTFCFSQFTNIYSFFSYSYLHVPFLNHLTVWPSAEHFLVPTVLSYFTMKSSFIRIYLAKLCTWEIIFQRTLLGTAFLCWCLGDDGELSKGGHCGLVNWISSSILKAFFCESLCGGQTTDILLLWGLLSLNVFVVSFSPLWGLSSEFMLLVEYLRSRVSSERIDPPLPEGGICPRPLL